MKTYEIVNAIDAVVAQFGEPTLQDVILLRNILTDMNPRECIDVDDVQEAIEQRKRKKKQKNDNTPIVTPTRVSSLTQQNHINLTPIHINLDTSKPNKDFK